jgi:hypothetical protein
MTLPSEVHAAIEALSAAHITAVAEGAGRDVAAYLFGALTLAGLAYKQVKGGRSR